MSDFETLEDEPIDLEPVRVSSDRLRGRIRDLIAAFMARPRPIPASDADLLNHYLNNSSAEFLALVSKISDLKERLALSRGPEAKAIERELNSARAERSDVVAEAAVSEGFQKARAEAKASYNIAIGNFVDEEEAISALRPYLGMPHLPAVEADKLSSRAILDLLTRSSPDAPKKGQMVLQMPEDYHRNSIFAARSALGSGLDRRLIGRRKMIPVPFDVMSAQAAEASGRGAFERSRRVQFLLGKDRPEGLGDWKAIDDFLPFAYRSLTVPMMPLVQPSCTQFSFREAFGAATWKLINDEQVAKSGGVCNVCGSDKSVEAHPRWVFREPLEGSYSPGVATLSRFISFCNQCANALRPQYSSLVSSKGSGSELAPDKSQLEWLELINRWTGAECESHARQAYLLALTAHQRRSRLSWIIDLSAQRSLFICLEAGFSFTEEGWIYGPDEQTFKIVGTPVFDRDRLRHFYRAPDIFELEWGTTLKAAELFMKDFDMALADRDGTGQRTRPDEGAMTAAAISLAKEGTDAAAVAEEIPVDPTKRLPDGLPAADKREDGSPSEANDAEKDDSSEDTSHEDNASLAPAVTTAKGEATMPQTPEAQTPASGFDEELGYDPSDPRFAGMSQDEIYAIIDAEGDADGGDGSDFHTRFCKDIFDRANGSEDAAEGETGFR